MNWEKKLEKELRNHDKKNAEALLAKYLGSFPVVYQDTFTIDMALQDIDLMQTLSAKKSLAMQLYNTDDSSMAKLRFKLLYIDKIIPLSDLIPMLECMGLKIIDQRSYKIKIMNNSHVMLSDFGVIYETGKILNIDAVQSVFKDAFYQTWTGKVRSDGMNRLVLEIGMHWREVMVLRAYTKYIWQLGTTFSQGYVELTLFKNSFLARQLIELFLLKFDPKMVSEHKNAEILLKKKLIVSNLSKVKSLDEDRIIRRFMSVILATVRTNYFQLNDIGDYKAYLSFKINPRSITDIPLPKPLFEIFVYSPQMEGIHLRAAKVSRGGIRWSERPEDFRTEVLHLMKAQQVKNAVIVPLGAKGGFVCTQIPSEATRSQIIEVGIECYKIFISALLDLTDNIIDGSIESPNSVICYDFEDPYLVVAADKGTAGFSDIANEITKQRKFWLGDAFASGGSSGYDHKKMGITARGAFESVKNHFSNMGIDITKQDIRVIGIGDMAGDVFGNGMLLSDRIQLIAAFNHSHIFLDPNPSASESFKERERLFNLENSTWADYSISCLSAGGAIYDRSKKSIHLSLEIQSALGIVQDKLTPDQLIQAILMAPVDLLWNGGIGTYVKASNEFDAQVGDRKNDTLRIYAKNLRVKVIVEGGNLGLTQLARVEYALMGGRINTDAIDNSAGVNCSDHEVNIKILLNSVIESGKLTDTQRNKLLIEMTDEVANLVLQNNRNQVFALDLATFNVNKSIDVLGRLIRYLEQNAALNREIEYLPNNEVLQDRKMKDQGLTRPELAVLFSYTKMHLKQVLLTTDLPEDAYIAKIIMTAFPERLSSQYGELLAKHYLRKEIIVMQIANQIIDNMGLHFIHRLQEETLSSITVIIKAYMVVREVFGMDAYCQSIKEFSFSVASQLYEVLYEFNRLVRKGTRWFVQNYGENISIEEDIKHFTVGIEYIEKNIDKFLIGEIKDRFDLTIENWIAKGLSFNMARTIAVKEYLSDALYIIEAEKNANFSYESILSVYFRVSNQLGLAWFSDQIIQHPVSNHWDALARAAYRDDLQMYQRDIVLMILNEPDHMVEEKIARWSEKNALLLQQWQDRMSDLKSQAVRDFTMYSVVIRALGRLNGQ